MHLSTKLTLRVLKAFEHPSDTTLWLRVQAFPSPRFSCFWIGIGSHPLDAFLTAVTHSCVCVEHVLHLFVEHPKLHRTNVDSPIRRLLACRQAWFVDTAATWLEKKIASDHRIEAAPWRIQLDLRLGAEQRSSGGCHPVDVIPVIPSLPWTMPCST